MASLYKSIDELKSEVEALGHWSDPAELDKYLEILYRITAFDITSKYEIDLTIPEGLTGTFLGYYNPDVRDAAREICQSKFPTAEEVWNEDGLKPGIPKEVAYLANYALHPAGLNYLVERTRFVREMGSKFGHLDMKTNVEDVKQLELSATLYLEGKNNSKKM